MNTTLSMWGNSLAVRFPKAIIDELGWHTGDSLEFHQNKGTVCIKKVRNIKRPPLSEILDRFHTAQEEPLVEWGETVGKEYW